MCLKTAESFPFLDDAVMVEMSHQYMQCMHICHFYFFCCLFQCSLLSSEIYEYLFIIVCLNTGIKH